jgi:hypothetical protein
MRLQPLSIDRDTTKLERDSWDEAALLRSGRRSDHDISTLDRRSDPDVLVLRRDDPDRTFVAVFSASGVTVQGIRAAVKEDRERRL